MACAEVKWHDDLVWNSMDCNGMERDGVDWVDGVDRRPMTLDFKVDDGTLEFDTIDWR